MRCIARGALHATLLKPAAVDTNLEFLELELEPELQLVCCGRACVQGCGALEAELAEAYDFVAPCFPPHYNIFDAIFQMYHVQFAQVRQCREVSGTSLWWMEQTRAMRFCVVVLVVAVHLHTRQHCRVRRLQV